MTIVVSSGLPSTEFQIDIVIILRYNSIFIRVFLLTNFDRRLRHVLINDRQPEIDGERALAVKEDMNFLEYPLWSLEGGGNGREEIEIRRGTGCYRISADRGLPTRTDKVFLYYMLNRILGTSDRSLKISRYNILKNTFGMTSKPYYKMLEKALDRWSSVNIVFEGIFYSGDKLTSRKFHVISVKQELEGPGELEIFFDPQFLEQQRNTQYYKLIDINEYKRLRKPISARLYELLTKNFSARESWKIEISGLCEKLTLKKHYPSQAMQKIIPALNEINANTEMKASVSWFKNSKGDYICHFRQIQPSIEGELSVKEIMTMVPPRKRSLIVENLIKNFKGDQKILISNLLYSLEKSNRNFSQFFRLALRDDWASHQRLEVRDYVDKFKEKMVSFSELVREETGCTDKETISEIVTAAINTNRENGFSDGYLDERMFREFAKGIWREMNCED